VTSPVAHTVHAERAADGAGAASHLEMLRAVERFQVERMRATHAALFLSPRYRPLCEFLLVDLYGHHEFRTRATTFYALGHMLRPILGRVLYEGCLRLIELQALSERLDDRVVRELLAHGATPSFTEDEFEQAYRRCDDYAERRHQIDLSTVSTKFVHALALRPAAARLLGIARRVRGLHRLEALLAMLERGHRAFSGVGEIGPFIEDMRNGEAAYLDGIYARRRA
jgi:hypothetical protein